MQGSTLGIREIGSLRCGDWSETLHIGVRSVASVLISRITTSTSAYSRLRSRDC